MATAIKVGDTIKFTTWDREGTKTATRKVTYVGPMGIGVNFNGWKPFYLTKRMKDKWEKVPPVEKKVKVN